MCLRNTERKYDIDECFHLSMDCFVAEDALPKYFGNIEEAANILKI